MQSTVKERIDSTAAGMCVLSISYHTTGSKPHWIALLHAIIHSNPLSLVSQIRQPSTILLDLIDKCLWVRFASQKVLDATSQSSARSVPNNCPTHLERVCVVLAATHEEDLVTV